MGYINDNTGEWTFTPPKEEDTVKLRIKEYVGLDTRFPHECQSEEELKSVVSNMQAALNYKLRIDEGYLLEAIIKGYLSGKGADSVKWLCKRICAWNYVFTTKTEIIEAGLTTKAHYSRWVKEMEPYFKISVIHKGLDNLRITIHPCIAWKGYDGFKDSALARYYGTKTDMQ